MTLGTWPEHLPPLPAALESGWTIAPDDEIAVLMHEDSALAYLTKYIHSNNVSHTILEYIAVNTEPVLRSPTFLQAPIQTLQAILEYPYLLIDEDDLLSHILRYATHLSGVQSHSPVLWSSEEQNTIIPVLKDLIPRLATYSISTSAFLRKVEPLGLLSVEALKLKYKYDALMLEGSADGKNEREIMLEFWGGSFNKCLSTHGLPWLRSSVQVAESSHPYALGVHDKMQISVVPWASHMYLEFDRRSAIAGEAKLCFYADDDCSKMLADWASMWRNSGETPGGRKFWAVSSTRIWLSFKCPAQARSKWGWKLIARPVITNEQSV